MQRTGELNDLFSPGYRKLVTVSNITTASASNVVFYFIFAAIDVFYLRPRPRFCFCSRRYLENTFLPCTWSLVRLMQEVTAVPQRHRCELLQPVLGPHCRFRDRAPGRLNSGLGSCAVRYQRALESTLFVGPDYAAKLDHAARTVRAWVGASNILHSSVRSFTDQSHSMI